jgi:hypothetical protein
MSGEERDATWEKRETNEKHFFGDNSLGMRALPKRIGLPTGGEHTAFVGFVSPAPSDASIVELTRSVESVRFSETKQEARKKESRWGRRK